MTTSKFKDWLLVWALWLGIWWGFAEGSIFFIVPDVLISLVALLSIKRSLQCMGAVLVGSLLAGTLLYVVSFLEPNLAIKIVHGVPFVRDGMFTKARGDFYDYGVVGMLMGPTSGSPYKIYAVVAPQYTRFLPFILTSIPARLERFIITWALFATVGFLLREVQSQHLRKIYLGHFVYWLAVYAYYLSVKVYG